MCVTVVCDVVFMLLVGPPGLVTTQEGVAITLSMGVVVLCLSKDVVTRSLMAVKALRSVGFVVFGSLEFIKQIRSVVLCLSKDVVTRALMAVKALCSVGFVVFEFIKPILSAAGVDVSLSARLVVVLFVLVGLGTVVSSSVVKLVFAVFRHLVRLVVIVS